MLLCMNYLLVSVIRGACNDWGQMYIISNKGQSPLSGSSFISSQEIGGIVGSLLTGYLSDFMVSKGSSSAKPRLSLTMFLTVIQTLALYFIVFKTDSQSTQLWTNSLGFFIGFGMYSAISLLGVASMETAPKNLSGTAHSLATLGGNLGRVLAGYPLSIIATWMSWHESFIVVFLTSFLSIGISCLCLRFLNIKEQSAPLKKFD
ncbi:unnamed protein product [Lymnaea stagnalis]|uniref:Major facilitator superfamily (MFS) profile domain-containing protein n=1 Tax=Lymnaea stagnalis TaxID=6523 RepID=A0AAV2IJ48_LYMST